MAIFRWRVISAWLVLGSAMILLAGGCSRSTPEPPAVGPEASDKQTGPGAKPALKDATFEPFATAVRLDAPDNELRPPDTTAGGKVTARLFLSISGKEGGKGGLWEAVRFVVDGKPTKHEALVKTDAGDFTIELLHEAAPNHVRSFVALARAGFFDGLPFHQSIRRESKQGLDAYLESGCPKGTGEIGYGSIGYWLKPEIKEGLKHEEGTVGAWHPEERERAACRFYITLSKNTLLNGHYTIFGKIVHGLDVAHTINKRPIQDEQYKGPPQQPHRIQQVLIRQTFEDGSVVP